MVAILKMLYIFKSESDSQTKPDRQTYSSRRDYSKAMWITSYDLSNETPSPSEMLLHEGTIREAWLAAVRFLILQTRNIKYIVADSHITNLTNVQINLEHHSVFQSGYWEYIVIAQNIAPCYRFIYW